MASVAVKLRRSLPLADPPEIAERRSERLELRIWLRLLTCATQIEKIVKAKLRREFGTSLARFDVLAQLDRFPDGLTMSDVSRHLMVSNGAITGLVDKLEAAGWVVREDQTQDKRRVVVRLTPAGRAQFRRMARRHEEWIVSLIGDLSREAQTELLRDLTLLKGALVE
jgi:DNA-binding MarR family transcriptional regulator